MRLPCSGAGLWGWRRSSLHWGRPLPSHMPAGAAAEPQQPFFGRSGRRLFVEAARKGDGKQRRPKKQEATEGPTPAPPPPSREPPRVTPQLGSMRQQLAWVKIKKEAVRRETQRPAAPTRSFRLPTKTEEEHREERAQREREAAELSKRESKNFALSQIHNTSKGRHTVLLVDGYNVIGERQNKANEPGLLPEGASLEEARDKLLDRLAEYMQQAGVRVVCAFDAMGNRGGVEPRPHAPPPPSRREMLSTGLEVVYCSDQEADSFLVAAVDEFVKRGFSRVVVATNDNMVALKHAPGATVESRRWGKQEIICVSVGRLKKDMAAAAKRQRQQLEEQAQLEWLARDRLTAANTGLSQLRQALLVKQRAEQAARAAQLAEERRRQKEEERRERRLRAGLAGSMGSSGSESEGSGSEGEESEGEGGGRAGAAAADAL